MTVHRSDELFARLGRDGLIGFGEAYLTGAWDAEDLTPFLTVLAADIADLVPRPLQRLRGLVQHRMPQHPPDLEGPDPRADRAPLRPVQRPLPALPGRVAELLRPRSSSGDRRATWRAAQHRKIDRLLDVTQVGEGTRVLEIGTGWGELRSGPPRGARPSAR